MVGWGDRSSGFKCFKMKEKKKERLGIVAY